ncbi:MAG: cyclic nucleotide-binding domain-containing protein [Acidobacteriota bacterium]|nr:cyclic nucleotide-binding domain-containing protein [Blastocatellia bacterium]MDW8412487.1 cyclic nucleotide-binding domain-containing protein [Acidobacteriota bacterium]
MGKELKRQQIENHHTVLQAIKGISAIEELAEFEEGHGYTYAVDLEVAVYGRNYGPGKKVGPYIKLYKYPPGLEVVKQGDWDTNTFFIVVEGAVEVFIKEKTEPVAVFRRGSPFGEMSVLAGVQRSATVKAHHEEGATLLEIQRPALRVLRKLKKFGAALDLAYRNNGRSSTLTELQVNEEIKKQISSISDFKVLSRGHVLSQEGRPMDRVIIIRDGWLRRSSGEDFDFIGSGYCLGLEGLSLDNARWPYKSSVVSRTEVLEIQYKKLTPELKSALFKELSPFGQIGTPTQPAKELAYTPAVKQAQEKILDKGLADATNLMVMDMDLCVRCGNCSLACHNIHGKSRLVRRGIHLLRSKSLTAQLNQSLLAPSVCLHCKDPECMTGCPTGAIGRFQGGQVDINPAICIGCGDCATQCPYNAISLIQRKELTRTPSAAAKGKPKDNKTSSSIQDKPKGFLQLLQLRYDEKPKPVTAEEDLVAIKCNLCNNTPLNPTDKEGNKLYKTHKYNCVENCPTGACMRIQPTAEFDEIKGLLGKALKREANLIYGRRLLIRDRGKQVAHLIGLLLTLLLVGGNLAGIVTYGLGVPLLKTSWFNFRWITGIVGLLGIIVVMLYPIRRQIWQRRAGALRYWMLAHVYAGVIAGIVLLLHGGTSLGGPFTAILMILFDLVILTGLIGIFLYWIGPRLLTKIEGEPLLREDLERRREELYQEIADYTLTTEINMKKAGREGDFSKFLAAREEILNSTYSPGFLIRQYLKRETLDELVRATQELFSKELASLEKQDAERLALLIKAAVTARRIDALLYIHRALKLWLPPHVILTSLMLACMLIHIVQVVYYLWR